MNARAYAVSRSVDINSRIMDQVNYFIWLMKVRATRRLPNMESEFDRYIRFM